MAIRLRLFVLNNDGATRKGSEKFSGPKLLNFGNDLISFPSNPNGNSSKSLSGENSPSSSSGLSPALNCGISVAREVHGPVAYTSCATGAPKFVPS